MMSNYRLNPRRRIVNVPFTEAQYEMIKGEAERQDSTMSAILRPVIAAYFQKLAMQPAEQ
jgi:hypothetical protein